MGLAIGGARGGRVCNFVAGDVGATAGPFRAGGVTGLEVVGAAVIARGAIVKLLPLVGLFSRGALVIGDAMVGATKGASNSTGAGATAIAGL